HLRRLRHREALARLDRLALANREGDQAPVHWRADRRVPLASAGASPGERVDEVNQRLPPAGEGVDAAFGLVERDFAAAAGEALHIGALDEMQPHRNSVGRDIDTNAAGADEFEGVCDTPRI